MSPAPAIPRHALVARVVRRKRAQHAELRDRITYAGLRTVCAREECRVTRVDKLWALGCIYSFLGVSSMLVHDSLDTRQGVLLMLHELGHVWLRHFDKTGRVGVPVAQAEAEADLFAAMMAGVPLDTYRAEMWRAACAVHGEAGTRRAVAA